MLEVQRVKAKIPDAASTERLINFGKTWLIELSKYFPWFDAYTVYEAILILPYANWHFELPKFMALIRNKANRQVKIGFFITKFIFKRDLTYLFLKFTEFLNI